MEQGNIIDFKPHRQAKRVDRTPDTKILINPTLCPNKREQMHNLGWFITTETKLELIQPDE